MARKQDRRRLPPELQGLLPAKIEHGLNHVVRRRLLRALHGRGGEDVSPTELAADELSDESLSGVVYHLDVLVLCDLAEETGAERVRNNRRHLYRSQVEDNQAVLSVLTQTEELDAPPRNADRQDSGTP